MNASLHNRAEALEARAAMAAMTAALARHDGLTADAELWEERAARLDTMAANARARSN